MGLNVAYFSAINLNYKGKSGRFRPASLLSRCTGSYGKSHEERQDYSQRPAVGLCSDRFPRGSGLPEGDGSSWELCLGQPLLHDLLNPSGTVEVAFLLLVRKFKTEPIESRFRNLCNKYWKYWQSVQALDVSLNQVSRVSVMGSERWREARIIPRICLEQQIGYKCIHDDEKAEEEAVLKGGIKSSPAEAPGWLSR